MKRVIAGLLLLIMVAFVSCDKPHEHQWKEEWERDEHYHWHSCSDPNCSEVNQKDYHQYERVDEENMKCSSCGLVMKMIFAGQIGVSKEQWNSALNMEEFPSVIKQNLYHFEQPEDGMHFAVEITEDTVYDYELDDTLTKKLYENCYVKENGSYWVYSLRSSDGKWAVKESSEESYNFARLKFITVDEKGLAEFFRYEDFQFNLTDNEYTCDELKIYFDGEELTLRNIVLIFEGNKLASYYFELVDDGACVCYKTTFSYNESDVNIPQYK